MFPPPAKISPRLGMVGAEGEHLEASVARLERSRDAAGDPHDVLLAQVDDVVVQLHPSLQVATQ